MLAVLDGAAAELKARVAAATPLLWAIGEAADIALAEGPVVCRAAQRKDGKRTRDDCYEESVEGYEFHLRWRMKAICTHVYAYAAGAALRAAIWTSRRKLENGLSSASDLGERLNPAEFQLFDVRLSAARASERFRIAHNRKARLNSQVGRPWPCRCAAAKCMERACRGWRAQCSFVANSWR
ncbi:hypothetical protein AB4Z46_28220 [Variovorax sp. M-6]|uniref:hypothetical protein n=1 Tax=Variovorax sp. M-6 TaxID=3233041 RepID=UPI003F9C22BF